MPFLTLIETSNSYVGTAIYHFFVIQFTLFRFYNFEAAVHNHILQLERLTCKNPASLMVKFQEPFETNG